MGGRQSSLYSLLTSHVLKNLTSSGSLDAAQPACTMGFPQPQHTLTPVRWGVREVHPGWRKDDVPRFQQHARAGSKASTSFSRGEMGRSKNHIPEGTFTSTRGNKKDWRSQKESAPGYFGSPDTGRLEFRAPAHSSASLASSSVLAAGKHHDLPASGKGAGAPPQ